MADEDVPFRILPRITDRNRFFWSAGADATLRFLACDDCDTWIHPPVPICPRCHRRDVTPKATSGLATLSTFTLNHQEWMPGPAVPFLVAIVDIDDAPGVRLTTNLVDVDPDDVEIGMPLEVVFEHHDDPDDPESPGVYIPLFRPVGPSS